MDGRQWLVLEREEFKFSCAHMTVFPDGSKERLHGHNYQLAIRLQISDTSYAAMIPFAEIKSVIRLFCKEWKEYLLLARDNPHFTIVSDADELEFLLCGKRYVLPREEVKLLPVDNITVEQLAVYIGEHLRGRFPESVRRSAIEISLFESAGQGVTMMLEPN